MKKIFALINTFLIISLFQNCGPGYESIYSRSIEGKEVSPEAESQFEIGSGGQINLLTGGKFYYISPNGKVPGFRNK